MLELNIKHLRALALLAAPSTDNRAHYLRVIRFDGGCLTATDGHVMGVLDRVGPDGLPAFSIPADVVATLPKAGKVSVSVGPLVRSPDTDLVHRVVTLRVSDAVSIDVIGPDYYPDWRRLDRVEPSGEPAGGFSFEIMGRIGKCATLLSKSKTVYYHMTPNGAQGARVVITGAPDFHAIVMPYRFTVE